MGSGRSLRRRIATGALAVALGLLFVELSSCGLYWGRYGEPPTPAALEQARGALANLEGEARPALDQTFPLDKSVPHPYLGFVLDPTVETWLNRDAVYVDGEIPTEAREGVVSIGVFGGSVAFQLANDCDAFRESLARVFEGREVHLTVAATPGWKQPQQLYALSYLLLRGYHFDVVLNLDGYNDLANASANAYWDVEPLYPYAYHQLLASYEGTEQLRLAGAVVVRREDRAAAARWMHGSPLGVSPTANLLWRLWDDSAQASLEADRERLMERRGRERTYGQHGPALAYGDLETDAEPLWRELARVWAESSVQMHQLAEARGARYVHFLQPNQYVAGSKRHFTDEEREEALSSELLRDLIPAGYPLFVAQGEALESRGVAFEDLTMIYAEVEDRVWNDWCCHLNERGNDLLADAIAARLAARLGAQHEQ